MDQQSIIKTHVEKPEKFKGSDFRRWQQKMLFYLTTLHVSNVLTDDSPSPPIGTTTAEGTTPPSEAQMAEHQRAVETWNTNEYNCRNYIRDWKFHEFQDGRYQTCPQTSGGTSSKL